MHSKKLPLGSITVFRRLRNLFQAFLSISFFKLVNTSFILAFSLVLHRVMLVSCSTVLHILYNQGNCGFRRTIIKSDVAAEIFTHPRLGTFACVTWRRFLLQNVGSSSSHSYNPEQHNLLEALDVGPHVKKKGDNIEWLQGLILICFWTTGPI